MAILLAGCWLAPAGAADTRLEYEVGLAEIYSQDVLRVGADSVDDYITSLALTGELNVTTARSTSEFVYTPTYFAYAEFTELDHLDHRYRGIWNLRPGPRSTFSLEQGYSVNTRQSGFTDLDGAGSEAGQPITGLTQRTAWELEPRWDRAQTARTTLTIQGLYRSEEYDRDLFVDTEQMGLGGGFTVAVGRGQAVGGRVRFDRYRYSGRATLGEAYDQFMSALVTWSLAATERFSCAVDAGAFRGTGDQVDASLDPIANLSGSWRWRRSSLAVSVGLGYSSGGGLTSSSRSERGDITYNAAWGRGFEASVYGTHIMREPVQRIDGATTLQGRSFAMTLRKTWQPGWGLGAGVAGLRQDQEVGRSLAYGEATVGVFFRPPARPERRPQPVPEPSANPL